MSFESWVDRQIREATERGAFDDLPGAGKPLPGIDEPADELWWVRKKLREEGVSYLPPSLALRKQVEDAVEAAGQARSEAEVRRILDEVNARVRAAIRTPPSGPPLNLLPIDVEVVVRRWRAERSG